MPPVATTCGRHGLRAAIDAVAGVRIGSSWRAPVIIGYAECAHDTAPHSHRHTQDRRAAYVEHVT